MMRPRVLLLLLQLSAAAAVATPATTTGSQARPSLAGRKILQEIVPFISNGQPVPRGQKTFMASLRKSWNGASCDGASQLRHSGLATISSSTAERVCPTRLSADSRSRPHTVLPRLPPMF